ncbi:phBC6A51 family helix-turn-helix protein [Desulfobacter curvatus]|uniref:phBC6A51 family helix-turn-helix protein n=1 Tax=Desulfobacter curvatus TaxID=2290 RepID=UPI00037C33A0|nr:hypothetical protein [Desulfobacter curvatus]
MSKHNETSDQILKGRKLKALEALITNDTVDEACKTIGIGRTTMYRYLKEPAFEAELSRAKRQLVNRAILRLQQTTGDAARALAEICRDKEMPASARVTAAKAILDGALRAVEIESIEERIKALEERHLNGRR